MEVQQRTAAELYLDLLKKCLTRYLFGEDHVPAVPPKGTLKHRVFEPVRHWLAGKDMEVIRHVPFDEQVRAEGRDWPAQAETMVGLRRLDNLQAASTDVLRRGVPGRPHRDRRLAGRRDHLHARGAGGLRRRRPPGVGGRLLRGPAQARRRRATPPTPATSTGPGTELAVSLEEVQANFARYGLLDDRVRFLTGWFKDTLPTAPIERLAVLRLDGDMYESTMDALEALYPKLSPGGFVIVDDYGASPHAGRPSTTSARAHGITDPIETIDWTGVYWQRSGD